MKNVEEQFNEKREILRHIESLWEISLWLIENEQKAADLVQNTIINWLDIRKQKGANENCKIELFKILVRIFYNGFPPNRPIPFSECIGAFDENHLYPSPRYLRTIPKEIIRRAISGLITEIKLLTMLSIMERFTYAEIAEITGYSREEVRYGLYLGRQIIRKGIFELLAASEEQIIAD